MSRRPKRNWRRSSQLPKARPETLSADEARRIAIRAQGFEDKRPHGSVGPKRLLSVAERLGALQIDSVNVLVRAHYMPAFSRLGPFRLGHLDDLAYKRRSLFEYWGHQASLLPTSLYPLFRHGMDRRRNSAKDPTYRGRYARWAAANRSYVRSVLKQVAERGPLGASELTDPGERSGPWWGWPRGKAALEWLFYIGNVTVAERRNWERLYDLSERVIPKKFFESRVSAEDAADQFLILAVGAMGVATADDLAWYFMQQGLAEARRRAEALAADGALQVVKIEGWAKPAFAPLDLRIPKGISVRGLVSPFDSLVWDRKRTSRLFGFDYRIEIYVPAPKRKYGYYVLPFLLGDRFVGRVDLKADRASRTLLIPAVHLEDSVREGDVLEALADELRLAAEWLGLDSIRPTGERKPDKSLKKLLG